MPLFCTSVGIPDSLLDGKSDGWLTLVDGFNDKVFTPKIWIRRRSPAIYGIARSDGAPEAAGVLF